MSVQDGSICCSPLRLAALGAGVLAASLSSGPETSAEDMSIEIARVHEVAASLSLRTLALRQEFDRLMWRPSIQTVPGSRSPNFIVLAGTDDILAGEVLQTAERLRRDLAVAWFGSEVPTGTQPAIIEVTLDDDRDQGLTWMAGASHGSRHRIWLRAPKDRVLGSTLAHEMTHLLMQARFPSGMPAWANEGAASLSDDPDRQLRHNACLRRFVSNGQWPSLAMLFGRSSIRPSDEAAYAVSTSLTRFLLARNDRQAYLAFVEDGAMMGWDRALQHHYQIASINDLQTLWQRWVMLKADR